MRYTTPMIIALTLLFSSTLVFAQGGRRKNSAKNDTIDVSVKKPFLDVYYGNYHLHWEKQRIYNKEIHFFKEFH